MQTLNYITDTNGNKTGLFIDLTDQKTDKIFSNLNDAQIEVLKLFAKGFPNEDLNDLKKYLATYLLKKIRTKANKIWDEKNYTTADFEKFVEND
jgi:hypothetical protein